MPRKPTSKKAKRTTNPRQARVSLAQAFPDIAALWHLEKNGTKTPDDVTPGSPYKAWWVCEKGGPEHDYDQVVNNKVSQNQGCPYCSGKRVCPSNSLAALYPEIARQWHKALNGDLTPWGVTPGSGKMVWWHCKRNRKHEYQAAVDARTSKQRKGANSGCPFCGHKRAHAKNNLAVMFPHIADEWHPKKNRHVTPCDVLPSSHSVYWWQCLEEPEHHWQMSCNQRTSKPSRCVYCTGHRLHRTNSLATKFPEVAKEWHPTLNGNLTPAKVTAGSNNRVHWQCPIVPSHVYEAAIHSRTTSGSGCPYCTNKRADPLNSLTATDPSIAAEWHPKLNGDMTPDMVTRGSGKTVWWLCPNEHAWECVIYIRTLEWRDCRVCKTLAFRFPDIAKEFDVETNFPLTPETISAASSKKVGWVCSDNPEHKWPATVSNRTGSKSGCPHCWKIRQQRGKRG